MSPTNESPRPPHNPQLEQAAAGWTENLTWIVLLGLAIEIVTGGWALLAPFSVVAQLQVLAHTAAGFLLLAPYAIYQWRHWLAWSQQTLSVVKLIGYAGMAVTVVSMITGVVVAAQSFFGRKLSPLWDQVHTITAIAVTALVVLHLGFAFARRRQAFSAIPDFRRRLRRGGLVLLGATAAIYVACAFTAELLPSLPAARPMPNGYALPQYAQKFAEYRGSPFAPTYARTSTDALVNPALLSGSASCGTTGCHEQILAEWEPSAHRFSAMNPPFQAVQKNFAHDRGAAETRYCAGCHDPISLFAGAKDVSNVELSAPGMQEGSSCIVCHAISKVDQRGNADYVLTPPRKYLGEGSRGLKKAVSNFLIRAYPRQHVVDYNRPVLRTGEFCGACHKQFIPEALNHFGAIPAQNQFDEWKKSHWVDESHANKSLSCRDCHMRLVQDSRDPGAGQVGDARRTPTDGKHRHHGFIATNSFMPELLKLPHWEEQSRLTTEWIQGKTVLPEIADVWPTGPAASIELLVPASAKPGSAVDIQAVVRNRKAGHAFTTGPLDFIRSWVHLRVLDASGATVAEWGGIDPVTRDIFDEPGKLHESSNARKRGTMVLESVPLDAEGKTIVRHDLWRKAGGADMRVIFPAHADKQTYHVEVPATARGPLRVEADLEFRRYRQEFLNLVVPDMERLAGVFQPTTTTDRATATIPVETIVKGPETQDPGHMTPANGATKPPPGLVSVSMSINSESGAGLRPASPVEDWRYSR
jgi:hypothetical protein